MRSGKILLGVLAGVAVGATLGILFAPARGVSTRRKIARKSGEYADELDEKYTEFVEGMTDKFNSLKRKASGMARTGKDIVEEAVAEVQS